MQIPQISEKMCTIYLVRHAESASNIAGTISGHSNPPLTPIGINQAKTRASKLRQISFAAAYSSDLSRAYQTASIIALEHQLAVTTTKLIRERNQGRLEGRIWHELQLELKGELARRDALTYEERTHFKFSPDYESDAELISRTLTFLREISLAHLDQTVLVVTHGGIMRTLLVHLGFATYTNLPTENIKNTAYVILRSDGTDFFIDSTVGIRKSNP